MNKLLVGFENIHFAPIKEDGTFGTPIRIENGRSFESELEYEATADWADNKIVSQASYFKGGKFNIKFLGINADEYSLLFGAKRCAGGYSVSENDISPTGAWLFEQKKKGSEHKKLSVIYCGVANPSKTAAESIIDGKAEAKEFEITGSVGSYIHSNGDSYIEFNIETDDNTVIKEQIDNWYTEVQFPREVVLNTPTQPVQNGNIEED